MLAQLIHGLEGAINRVNSPISTMAMLFTDWDNEAFEAKSTGPEVWQYTFQSKFGKMHYGPDTLFSVV